MRHIFPKKRERGAGGRAGDDLIENQVILPRAPQKNDASLPTLSHLSTEVITMIIDVLYNDSPASADELACTSSFYYHLTRYRQYREVCVAISTTTNEVAFQNRLVVVEKEGLLPAIRRVRARIGAIDKQKCTTTMVEFIGKMTTLIDLEWRYAKNIKMSTCVPNQLISLLQSRPQVRLHAGVSPPSVLHPRSEHDLEYNLYRLEGLKNLSSFEVRFTYRKPKTNGEVHTTAYQNITLGLDSWMVNDYRYWKS
ncbi:unnamed protein product [Clonostachys rhizophaga]|uniref:Uncharacterized protein n=1 Tax=Clonostachys rhizophaga TaxID=160324 RepID=A0A9N9VFM7_9HYPO|nr:unnamed protein product [Clonostachys rhizophaga]